MGYNKAMVKLSRGVRKRGESFWKIILPLLITTR
nr:MAG TPA: hypothetical protein [Caudoviricetes sp.]